MHFSHFFIRRPIFAAVLSIIIVLVGGIALIKLPVASYPEVVPPTIFVLASYPGANADTLAATVATPLEQEINGVENMLYMTSSCSSDGSLRIQVTFKTGTDLDMAQVHVQNRVSSALPKLPEDVKRLGVMTKKRSPNVNMLVNLVSPNRSHDSLFLSNYAYLQVKDTLSRLPGVGDVVILGAGNYSMRIWIDPDKASSRNLTASDIVAAIREQNIQVTAGSFGQQPQTEPNDFQLVARIEGRLSTVEQFGDIVLKTNPTGQITRLRDVARIELGARDYNVNCSDDGNPSAGILIAQLPGSNAIDTAKAVRAAMKDLAKQFPKGISYTIPYDTTVFINESIDAVFHTLFEAMLLVVLVVVLFLQNWRASLIPLLAVPVSLIGTFAAMAALGFSLNNLSLFALVLAIGIVVDDAIVVVENVERHIANGLPPIEATEKAMDEVSGAVVAIALVLCAVFVPTAFISGLSGRFYQQFSLTIAVSTLISAFNSLTLSPALSALLLQPHHAPKDIVGRIIHGSVGWLFTGFNRCFDGCKTGYIACLRHGLRHCGIALFLYVGLLVLTGTIFQKVPTGFVPSQDKGTLIAYLQLPDGSSLTHTQEVSDRVRNILLNTPGVAHVVQVTGFSVISFGNNTSNATMFMCLKPFQERKKTGLTAERILKDLRGRLAAVNDGYVGVFGMPPIEGLGSLDGVKLQIQDRKALGFNVLQSSAMKMIGAIREDKRFTGSLTTLRAEVPQIALDVDRAKAKTMQVPLSNVWDTLQIYLGSLYVNDFNIFGRPFQVNAQADAPFRAKPENLLSYKTRNASGEMVPLGTLVKLRNYNGPVDITKYNIYPAADLTVVPAHGVSTGEAMAAVEEIAGRVLPPGITIEWTEMSFLEKLAGNSSSYIFPLCVVMVFLVLAAQYESWSLPLSIILIVPMCLLAAMVGVWSRGMDNNLFTQIGLVVLIGLACKNAILIVEFAKQLQNKGKSAFEAILEACDLRLRPILMTSFAFTFGVLPMVFARGAGAEMRQAMGTAVFFGMLGVTFFGIVFTPVFYLVIRKALERHPRKHTAALSPAAANIAILGAVAVLLAGCSAGSNFHQPKTNVPVSFVNAGESGVSSDPVREETWWKRWNDPVMDGLIHRALSSNQDVRIAAARIKEAKALRTSAVLDALPVIQGEAGYSRSVYPQDAYPGYTRLQRQTTLYDVGSDATWELDLFGRVRRNIEASRADVALLEANRQGVLVSLSAEVAVNYLELRGAQKELAVALENAENQRQTLKITEAQFKAGSGNDLDLARGRAQLDTTLASVAPLQSRIKQIIYRIGVLTGQQPQALEPELSKSAPLPKFPTHVAVGNPAELLRRRPDIRQSEAALHAATARVGVQTADLFPRVTFQGNLGIASKWVGNLSDSGADTYAFGPHITWAALDMGHVYARIKAAHARADVQAAAYEKAVNTALQETESSLVGFGKAQLRAANLKAADEEAKKAVKLARLQYDSGVGDFLNVLDAQRVQFSIEDQLAQSETLTVTSLVAVYKALGGELEPASKKAFRK